MRRTIICNLIFLVFNLVSGPCPSHAENDWAFYGKSSVVRVCVDMYDRKWFLAPDSLYVMDGAEWRAFSEAELGFPMSSVLDLEAAPDSSIWLGTLNNGAVRYFENSWQVYTIENSGIGSNRVNAIDFDTVGGVWFLTPDRCMVLNDNTWRRFRTTTPKEYADTMTCMAVAGSQLVYFGTKLNGVEVSEPNSYYYINKGNEGLADNSVTDMGAAPGGSAFFGTAGGLSILKDERVFSFTGLPVRTVYVETDTTAWFANEDGFSYCDDETVVEFSSPKTDTETDGIRYGNSIWGMAIDQERNLWFATDNGIYRFSGRLVHLTFPKGDRYSAPSYMAGSALQIPWISRRVENVRLEYSLDAGETWNLIASSIRVEPEKFTWNIPYGLVPVGYVAIPVKIRISDTEDLSIQHIAEIRIETPGLLSGFILFDRNSDPLFSRPVEKIVESPDGVKWLENFSLIRYDGFRFQQYTDESSGLVPGGVNDLTMDRLGNLWCAQYSGLSRYDGSSWRSWFRDRSIAAVKAGGDVVWVVCADSSNASGQYSPNRSLYRFDIRKLEPERIMSWDDNSFNVDSLGNIWLFRYGEEDQVWTLRLKRFDGTHWTSSALPFNWWVRTQSELVWDRDGRIWCAASSENALYCFDGENWKKYPLEGEGTIGKHFNSITLDRNGNIWGVMDDAIGIFDGERWKVLDQEHGWLFNRVGSLERIFVDRGNVKWIIGSEGFFRYDDRLVRVNEHLPEPVKLSMLGNFPNPFNPSTTITFSLPATGRATLAVYSITGQKVRELVSGHMPAGMHSVVWDGKDASGHPVSSGVYLSRLESGRQAETRKMLLMR